MIETAGDLSTASAIAVVLAVIGLSIAWLPALRYGGAAPLLARFIFAAGIAVALLDMRGLGAILGLGLAAMGLLAGWETRPAPEVPRPRRKGVIFAAAVTALIILAALHGWWLLGRVPDQATGAVALALGAAAALGTLAIADRARIRMRDAVRERFGH